MAKKKKIITTGILGLIAIVALSVAYPLFAGKLFSKPKDLGEAQSVEIELYKPIRDGDPILYKGSITDPNQVAALKNMFMEEGRSCNEHQCASLGFFKFKTTEGTKTIEILPGHNEDYYEFRYDKQIYRLDRAIYISTLRGLKIPKEAIVLDGHPAP